MIPLIKLTDQCMKPEVSAQQLSSENVARTLLDVIALMGHADCELIQRRRDLINKCALNMLVLRTYHLGTTSQSKCKR